MRAKMEQRRRVLVYGQSLILEAVRSSLGQYRGLDLVPLVPPLPTAHELAELAPDVIIFDIAAACPEAALSLLEACPGLLLIGLDPGSDQMLLWTGERSRALTAQDLVQAIDRLGSMPQTPLEAPGQ